MKLTDLISKIDIDKVVKKDSGGFSGIFNLLEEFNLSYSYSHDKVDAQDRLFSEFVSVSYCTDTWVGLKVYVFDREVVAFSGRQGRKYDEEFSWVSKEAYNKVKEFCLSFAITEEDSINLVDDEEIPDEGYTLYYSGELIPHIHKTAKLDGEVVTVVKDAHSNNPISSMVVIQGGDDKVSEIKIDHLVFPYQCLKE